MKIECPNCQTDNDIDFAEHIVCNKCKHSFKGFNFGKRKLVSAGTALAIGLIGGYKVNGALEDERYPLEVEYAIIDTCVNASKNLMPLNKYESKRDICLCALAKTEESVPYPDFISDQQLFSRSFELHAKACDKQSLK